MTADLVCQVNFFNPKCKIKNANKYLILAHSTSSTLRKLSCTRPESSSLSFRNEDGFL